MFEEERFYCEELHFHGKAFDTIKKKIICPVLENHHHCSPARPEPITQWDTITIFQSLSALYFFLTQQLLLNLIKIDGNGA